MPHTQVKTVAGESTETLELSDRVFGATRNIPLVHQAVVRHLANQRQGTSNTKTRSNTSGTTKKMFRQKGTGRSRHGDQRSNIFRGGAVAHGPHPRDYRQEMPQKMRRQALRSALSSKLADGTLIVVEDLEFDAPSTKRMVQTLATVVPGHRRLLLVLGASSPNVQLSVRNIPDVRAVVAGTLNTYDVVAAGHVVIARSAISQIEGVLGDGAV